MRYTRSVPVAMLALLVTAACDTSKSLVAPDSGEPTPNRSAFQPRLVTPDDEFARVSRAEVPGFAGFYLQEDGTPVVRLVDQKQRGAAQRYLARQMAEARRGRNARAPQQPVFLPAAYDFAQLKEWSDELHPLLASRGDVYTIDVDEVGNRVTLGVADAAAIAAVRAEAAELGIPASAVHVKTQPKPEQRITVQDWHNPLYGGIQIAFLQYVCTLGFNATRVATLQSIFVTNSHCTDVYFAPDGGPIYQNLVAGANLVGNEVADVAPYNCIIPPGPCRMADAAYIGHNGTRGVAQGIIARTPWPAVFPGPAPINEIGVYEIVGRLVGNLPVGTWLDKTGRTSGSTYGQVIASCVSIGNLRCQDVSTTWSQGGDSGSPVYYYLGGAGAQENDVLLRGVLWGGPQNDFNTTYISPLAGIEADLGALTNLCIPGLGC